MCEYVIGVDGLIHALSSHELYVQPGHRRFVIGEIIMATTYFVQEVCAAGQVRCGSLQEAQEACGKIKLLDLPVMSLSLTVGKPFCSVEAVKAVLDL